MKTVRKKKTSPIISSKRLDGKKKLVSLTAQMENDIRSYCREKGIENESELIRQAVAKYLDSDYDDNTLKLLGLKDIRESVARLHDMVSVLFSYIHLSNLNTLAYHPEIAPELKDAAMKSATLRHDKFFAGFQERLKEDAPFFERLLHIYVTGAVDE